MDSEPVDNSLKIKVFKENNEERVQSKREKLNPNLIEPHFVIGITAAMKNGKTNLLCNLVVFYRKFFDKVIFLSPSAELDEKIEKCLGKNDVSLKLTSKNLEEVIAVLKQNTFDAKAEEEGTMPTMTELILGKKPRKKKKKLQDTLLILDDASVNKSVFDKSSEFLEFVYSHRKFNTSIISVVHYHKLFPLQFRAVINALIIFQMGNEQELRGILEEHGLGIDKDVFKKIVEVATKEPFSFLVINKNKPIDDGRFMIRFQKKIIPR